MVFADAIAFIERVSTLKTSQAVGVAFGDWIKPSGFIAVSGGESRETPSGRVWDFFFNTWPEEWLRHYQTHDFVRYDLAPTLARLTARPFTWRESILGREQTEAQIAFNTWVASLGIADALVVPLHYPGADLGICVILADHPITSATERLALHLVSIHVCHRCRELGGNFETSSVKTLFTPREVECFRWVLEGKSDTDIGDILNISSATAHFHIERVKRKLGVKTRTQAAAAIVMLGYL